MIIEEMSIVSNCCQLEWRTGLSDTILKGDNPTQIWYNSFRRRFKGDFLNQNMPNLYKI
jgi:hypothetical protein